MTGLGKPAGAQHLPSANRAFILSSCHSGQGRPLIGIIIKNLPGDAAWKLCAMEAVYMTFDRLVIFRHALFQVQSGAYQCRVKSIAQSIMGRTCSADPKHFHSRFQRFLRIGAISLGIKDHLGIVPLVHPLILQPIELKILFQNSNIIKAPGQEDHFFTAPRTELFNSLFHGQSFFTKLGFLNACQLADPAV